MTIYRLEDQRPDIPLSAFIADNATVIGKVRLGENASVWFGATLRGDNEPITIGADTNIQEGAVLHTDMGSPLSVGARVTIGHQAVLHGCTVGDEALIGIQAVILNDAVIGPRCLVAAGALVTEGKHFEEGSLIVGAPARVLRPLSEVELRELQASAAHYVRRQVYFRRHLRVCGDVVP